MSNVLIIGATSAIAESLARLYATKGAALFLAARDRRKLETIAADLKVRGAKSVSVHEFDADTTQVPAALVDAAWQAMGKVDVAVLAFGSLSDQARCSADMDTLARELRVNGVTTLLLAEMIAGRLEKQGEGSLVVLGSVAGDRGRASNYAYGAAKGAIDVFCSGLRQRFSGTGIHVLTVKPGFVDTPMTAHMRKGFLWASPTAVAASIHRATESRKPVLYTPWFWWLIMSIVRAVPERIFVRFGPR